MALDRMVLQDKSVRTQVHYLFRMRLQQAAEGLVLQEFLQFTVSHGVSGGVPSP